MRLTAEDLNGERGGQPVFSGVGFSLGDGRALTVTGPNGSGKSTLLRVVAGLLPAAGGSVRLEGGGEAFPTVASAAHYLGHLNAMKPTLTVAENLAFWRDFCGDADVSVGAALETVGLGAIGASALRLPLHRPAQARGDRAAAGQPADPSGCSTSRLRGSTRSPRGSFPC